MNVVIYARFSSHSQTEQSIEGQIKVCKEYAQKNDYNIIGTYIDRALTGTSDKRPEFQKMILDSNKKQFQGVLVYQLDRFARNRYDSATYKNKLKKNGVRVFSAKENISDDASGVLMESVLEGMAEYYSAELSQKVRRGMDINASKCLYNGGHIPLGYKIEDKKYIIDTEVAPIVKNIFQMYADDNTMLEIAEYLNNKGIKTARGHTYKKNNISLILRNRKYLGIYIHNDIEIKGGIPQIVPDDLFNEVQEKISKNSAAPARGKAKTEYLLTTKLFCGHCKEMMSGTSGTSQNGSLYTYYTCNGIKKKKCHKKNVSKDFIENIVISEIKNILTDENIKKIAKEVMLLLEKDGSGIEIKRLNKLLKQNEEQKANLLSSLKICNMDNVKKAIFEEIAKLDIEYQNIQKEIAIEKNKNICLTEYEICFFLEQIKRANINNTKYNKILIATFVNKIYLYDDKIVIIFTTQDRKVQIDKILLDKMESSLLDKHGEPKL